MPTDEGNDAPAASQKAPRADRETIAGLARGLSVIRAFSETGSTATLAELSRIAQLSPAAVRRCIHTLEELGYMGRTGRQFFLRPRVLDLSAPYLNSVNSETLANDYLQSIVQDSGHTASLATLDGDDVVYLAHVGRRRALRLEASIGTRYPAFATSLGRAILAYRSDHDLKAFLKSADLKKLTSRTVTDRGDLFQQIRQARTDGYSIVEDQLAVGVMSIAVPVYAHGGSVVAAINCSAQSGEADTEALKSFLPTLLETSRRITNALRYFPALGFNDEGGPR